MCIENILARTKRNVQAAFYRTVRGAKIDLVLQRGFDRIALEFKASTAPRIQKGLRIAMEDLGIKRAWVIAPVESTCELHGETFLQLGQAVRAGLHTLIETLAFLIVVRLMDACLLQLPLG